MGGTAVDGGGGGVVDGMAKRAFSPKSASHSSKNSKNSSSIAAQSRRDGPEWSEKEEIVYFHIIHYNQFS